MENIKVSIIMPLYNNERSIARCLSSIFNQKTSYEFEVIAVIDPCKDNTLKIVEEYAEKHSNLRIYNVLWRSIYLARDFGIKNANGKYLMFIDGDDYYKDNAIEEMVKLVEKNNADIAVSSFYYVRNKKIRKNFFAKNRIYNKKGMLKALMQDSYMHGFMWNKIYKAELLKNHNFIAPKTNIIREDVLLNFQVFLKANKLVMINKPLYYYDKTFESTTSSKNDTRVPWFLTIFAVERYLLNKYEPKYLTVYYKLNNRRKLLIWGDKLIVKKFYTKEEFKSLNVMCKQSLKLLNNKKELVIKNTPWEQFFNSITTD